MSLNWFSKFLSCKGNGEPHPIKKEPQGFRPGDLLASKDEDTVAEVQVAETKNLLVSPGE